MFSLKYVMMFLSKKVDDLRVREQEEKGTTNFAPKSTLRCSRNELGQVKDVGFFIE